MRPVLKTQKASSVALEKLPFANPAVALVMNQVVLSVVVYEYVKEEVEKGTLVVTIS